MRGLFAWTVGGAVLALACATPPAGEAEGEGGEEALAHGLVHSLNVAVEPGAVRLRLHVTNAGAEAVVVEFPTTQQYDFAVEAGSGESVWRWSAAQSFLQVLSADTLAAGATREYEATWEGGGRGPGQYVAVGWLTSSNLPVELRTEFEIPAS